jgi:hypothetical protein
MSTPKECLYCAVYLKNKAKRTYHHRARRIMEFHLNRKLGSSEEVHHIDENESNNNFKNLQLLLHQDHCRLHASLSYRAHRRMSLS